MLDALGARDAVDTVVSSGDVTQAKPDPEIAPHRTVAVPDRPGSSRPARSGVCGPLTPGSVDSGVR